MLLIAGGEKDFNLQNLIKNAPTDVSIQTLLIGTEDGSPYITWNLDQDRLIVNGKPCTPTAVFLRQDVFTCPYAEAIAWYDTIRSWAMFHPEVALFNRKYIGMNKAYNLMWAKKMGLQTPETLITNQYNLFEQLDKTAFIVKPVSGGSYTLLVKEYLEKEDFEAIESTPIFLQEKMIAPEVRVFGIGKQLFAYKIHSALLDYRIDKAVTIEHIAVPRYLRKGLLALMQKLSLDFCAADFKTNATTGKLCFLEINSSPMFAAFDAVSEGAISNTILNYLLKK
jgi:hypothetical protein